jgi:hypothetical protein
MGIFKGTSKDDELQGSSFADLMLGRGGDDLLRGQEGNDLLRGQRGDDVLQGGEGTNVLDGGSGNDALVGEDGRDTLTGGRGDDLLIAGFGPDWMIGGRGNDIYSVDDEDDRVLEHERSGTDEVSAWLSSYRLGETIENLSFAGSGDFHGTGNAHSNIISAGEGNDVLDGARGDDFLQGFDGNDTLLAGSGDDKLAGGYGNDVLTGVGGDDLVDGGIGKDTVRFSGNKDDYAISILAGQVVVADINPADGDDGTDVLTRVEMLQFKDGSIPSPGSLSFVDLAALNGADGFTIPGLAPGDASGNLVSSAGDVNGDGFDDLLTISPGADDPYGYDRGETYVVFGKATGTAVPSFDLNDLNGVNGFRTADRGFISAAGDVNADGFTDFLVGGNLIFGKADWSGSPSLDPESLDGTNGIRFHAQGPVSSAGDVNGDGFDDFIVGAPFAGYYGGGESYVVFGKADWSGSPTPDITAPDGANGFKLVGTEGYSGFSVSSAGDVNGDGFDDLIVLAPFAYNERYERGQSYVVFGKSSWAETPALDLGSLDGINGFRLSPIDVRYSAGHLVSTAGDFNGDGFDDLIIGAPYGAGDSGESYVVFGKESWVGTPSVDLAALDGGNGIALVGIKSDDVSGWSVASAGDVNGDGFDDVIVGAPQLGSELGYGVSRGESYLVYGKADWSGTPALDLAALDGSNGFTLLGADIGDGTGLSASSAGDLNGDGFSDLVIGAPGADKANGFEEGASYVVFGGNFAGAVTHLAAAGDDTLSGTIAAETFVGGAGDDTLIGNGGEDAFQGGAGDDTVHLSTVDFFMVDGGSGFDTLALDGSDLILDLTTLGNSLLRSIERIDLEGDGNNALKLSALDVLNLSEVSNELLVQGDAGDTIDQGPGWTLEASGGTNGDGTSTIDGQVYQIYTAGNSALLLDTDMTVNA